MTGEPPRNPLVVDSVASRLRVDEGMYKFVHLVMHFEGEPGNIHGEAQYTSAQCPSGLEAGVAHKQVYLQFSNMVHYITLRYEGRVRVGQLRTITLCYKG